MSVDRPGEGDPRRISRRQVLALLGTSSLAALAAACAPDPNAGRRNSNIVATHVAGLEHPAAAPSPWATRAPEPIAAAPATPVPRIPTWPEWRSRFQRINESYDSLKRAGKTQAELYETARDCLREGVSLYNVDGPNTISILLDDKNIVDVLGGKLDLTSKQGLVFAGAILYTELGRKYHDKDVEPHLSLHSDYEMRGLNRKINILESDSRPFVDPLQLARLAILLPAVEKTGLDYPKEWS